MIAELSPPVRRLLALAILVALPLLAWQVVVDPLVGMVTDRQAAIADQAERLENLEAIIARIPVLRSRDEALRTQLDTEGGIWVAGSEAVVSARMEEIVHGPVDAGGGTVVSSAPLPAATEQEFQVVKMRFRIDATLETIQQTLAAIDAARPAIFVDAFQISAPADSAPTDRPPILSLDVEVMGYLRKEEQ